MVPYSLAQLLGAIAAAAVVALRYGGGSGTHVPTVPARVAVGTEVLLTFLLTLAIISGATDKRVNGAVPGLAIGLIVVVDVLIGDALTGGSMNPARSFGPALFSGGATLASYWSYVVGPAAGAVIAAVLYEAVRGSD